MFKLLLLLLVLLAGASCAPAANELQTAPTRAAKTPSKPSAPVSAFADAPPTGTTLPPANNQPQPSAPTTPSGEWKTYVASKLGVAIDYPADWAVREQPLAVAFTSAQGETIQLSYVDTGPMSPDEFERPNLLPNTRCAPQANAHGLQVRVCFDTIARTRTAEAIVRTSGAARLISLSTTSKAGSPTEFDTMVASLRPAP